jgi:hypothetical protein
MYLSYSGHKGYVGCQRIYWHQYVNKTQLEIPENKVNALFGTVVGNLFELFYRDRLWRMSGIEQRMLDILPSVYTTACLKETRHGAIRWKGEDPKANYASEEALLADVRTAIPRGLQIIRHHRLLGPVQSEAEIVLDYTVGEHIIGGRADFLIKRIAPHDDLILLDGKGSKWRGKYVDERQLKWYAMLHRLKRGCMPDKIGFVFWRFEAEQALDWVDFSEAELVQLQGSVLDSMNNIAAAQTQLAALPAEEQTAALASLFPVSPGDRCRLCAFRPLCPEGQHFDTIRAEVPSGAGVEDVGFNG